jgi:hypothetical protein
LDGEQQARLIALLEYLEIHHTPQYGSWLNIAEIELSLLSRQYLDWRIPDTTTDAHIKLKRLYLSIECG